MERVWSTDGSRLISNQTASPCGLFPKNYPLDNFWFFRAKEPEKPVILNTTDITWSGLKGNKYNSVNTTKEWLDLEDERFINWMRPNTFPYAYKSWGRLEEDLEPGNYTLKIFNCTLTLPNL